MRRRGGNASITHLLVRNWRNILIGALVVISILSFVDISLPSYFSTTTEDRIPEPCWSLISSTNGFMQYIKRKPPRTFAVSRDCSVYSLTSWEDCERRSAHLEFPEEAYLLGPEEKDTAKKSKCVVLYDEPHYENPQQRPPMVYYPKLKAQGWWDPTASRATRILEENFDVIYSEYQNLLRMDKLRLHPDKLAEGNDWKIFTLWAFGEEKVENTALCPETAKVIRSLPEAHTHVLGLIYFSLLFPGVHVKSHYGPTNIRLRIHLGLDTPEGATFRVGNETRPWEKGKAMLFDDSFIHEVWHRGNETRAVLLMDIWHPDFLPQEVMDLSRHLDLSLTRD